MELLFIQASFVEFAPHYFAHCAECGAAGTDSCLSKVLGFYHVQNKSEHWSIDIVITENVFYEKELYKTFDLKGIPRSMDKGLDKKSSGTHSAAAGAAMQDPKNMTQLDDQLRQSILVKPLTVAPDERQKLMQALRADTAFLARVGVMDYSLLLGIDRHNVCPLHAR
jgi:1-phosphatidylinositol-3-phosphate 5-kinase